MAVFVCLLSRFGFGVCFFFFHYGGRGEGEKGDEIKVMNCLSFMASY